MRSLIIALTAVCVASVACNNARKKPAAKKTKSEPAKAAASESAETKTATLADQAKRPTRKTIPAPADVAAPPEDAKKTSSGLASKVLEPGDGEKHPTPNDMVTVHYTGWTTDGKMFDSSRLRGQPTKFALNAVIPGWTEGVQLMVEGEKRRFWIPEELAYKGNKNAPQGMLVFDVELIDIVEPPPTPENLESPPDDAKKTASGLATKVLEEGTGKEKPKPYDTVEIDFSGWTSDGKLFGSSVMNNRPARFPLNRVVPGWSEGIQMMTVGEKRRLWIPAELAYKDNPSGPQGDLVIDVELKKINKGKPPVPAPADVAAPPKDATRTKSGLAYKVLEEGSAKTKPQVTDRVKVHYSGWTTDGKMFDSSVQRGQPATFGLKNVIPGWTEMLQLMTVGEKVRVWIPQKLAYGGRPGAPQGMLVFEIELLEIM